MTTAILEIILRFIWDVVVLVSTVVLAWKGVLATEVVTAVIGLYAGLYGGAMGMGPRGGNSTPTKPNILPALIVAGVALSVLFLR